MTKIYLILNHFNQDHDIAWELDGPLSEAKYLFSTGANWFTRQKPMLPDEKGMFLDMEERGENNGVCPGKTFHIIPMEKLPELRKIFPDRKIMDGLSWPKNLNCMGGAIIG